MGLLSMMASEDMPSSTLERVQALENMLVARATGEFPAEGPYQELRRALMADAAIRDRLPSFVRTCRSLAEFWAYIKKYGQHYQQRREHIWAEFRPLVGELEGSDAAPADAAITETLAALDAEEVRRVWQKAIERRKDDPDGAITIARTLLETVCKHILDEAGRSYDGADLPKLFQLAVAEMSLAPSQQSEPLLKDILGSCQNIVNKLGALRNAVGDSHGRGAQAVRVENRHADLAVNLAGAMSMFLVESWLIERMFR